MAYTTIDDPSAHFQTKIYAGTGSAQSLTNDGKYGNFEYAPPSGFYALCTKRLAEFG